MAVTKTETSVISCGVLSGIAEDRDRDSGKIGSETQDNQNYKLRENKGRDSVR